VRLSRPATFLKSASSAARVIRTFSLLATEGHSRIPLVRIMSKYKRNMRKCEAVFANRADYRGRRETAGDYLRLAGIALRAPEDPALDQAAPLTGWLLPECFAQLRRLLEARLNKHGSREYVQVLRLMETFALTEVTHAVEDALLLGTIIWPANKTIA